MRVYNFYSEGFLDFYSEGFWKTNLNFFPDDHWRTAHWGGKVCTIAWRNIQWSMRLTSKRLYILRLLQASTDTKLKCAWHACIRPMLEYHNIPESDYLSKHQYRKDKSLALSKSSSIINIWRFGSFQYSDMFSRHVRRLCLAFFKTKVLSQSNPLSDLSKPWKVPVIIYVFPNIFLFFVI